MGVAPGQAATEAATGSTATTVRAVDHWAERYLTADELERRLVAAAVTCLGRWGLAKTSLDDIAREAGVSRATVYRVFPGGKDRLVATVVHHEIGRLFHQYDAAAKATTSLEDLLCVGVDIAMEALTGPPLAFLIRHEPHSVLSVFAFERLTPLLAEVTALAAPHLARFLPADQAAPGAELVARIVLSYSLSPSDMLRPTEPESIRRFVRTYLVPTLTQGEP